MSIEQCDFEIRPIPVPQRQRQRTVVVSIAMTAAVEDLTPASANVIIAE